MNYNLFNKARSVEDVLEQHFNEPFENIGYNWFGVKSNKYAIKLSNTGKLFDKMIINLKDLRTCERNIHLHEFYFVFCVKGIYYLWKYNPNVLDITEDDRKKGYTYIDKEFLTLI